jgi:hypothetical protein
MHLTLIVPGLNACSASVLAATPPLRRLAVFAKAPAQVAGGIDVATLEALGLAASTPIAPLRALGAGLDFGDDYVMAADPVPLVAGRDDVTLDSKIGDLSADETAALLATLNAHFEGDGLAFAAPRPDAWFVRTRFEPRLETTPVSAVVGRPIFEYLPQGDDGKLWQRWQNEIQMLLHAHPVNVAREARGARTVTGLWFWGGGRMRDVATPRDVTVAASAGDAGDLLRGHARHAGRTDFALPASVGSLLLHAPVKAHVAIAALPVVDGDRALARLTTDWFAPAVTAVARGAVTTLALVADGAGVTTRWQAPRPSRFVRLTVRWRGSRFFVPEIDPD